MMPFIGTRCSIQAGEMKGGFVIGNKQQQDNDSCDKKTK
jgi:hypothetical protein